MFLYDEYHGDLLRYRLFPGEPVDRFTLEVLRQNPPDGVFLLGQDRRGGAEELLIPTAGYLPITEDDTILFDRRDADKLLEEVFAVRDALRSHMIPTDQLLLRPELTFLGEETGDLKLLVLPTPLARDLSLSPEHYDLLVRGLYGVSDAPAEEEKTSREKESAKPGASPARPSKPLSQRLREFWENLD